MASRAAEQQALVDRVKRVGWPVTKAANGDGFRVTCPDGRFVNIHLTPSDRNAGATVLRRLNDRGLADAEAALAAQKEEARQARLTRDAERNKQRTVQAERNTKLLAKAQGVYATVEPTINEILANHPAPISWTKVNVTPEMAKRMLDHNTHNRAKSSSDQQDFETKLRTGRVLHTHQGIAFDVLGRVLDGQTRIAAVEATGINCPFMVSAGWPIENFAAVDTARRRTAAQVLKMEGVSNSAWVSAAVRLLVLYDAWKQLMLDHTRDRIGNDQIVGHAAKLDQDDVHAAVRAAARLRKETREAPVGPAGVVAALYLIRRAMTPDYEPVDEFAEQLALGVRETDDPVIYVLRRQLMGRRPRPTGSESMALVIKAWNYRLAGETRKYIGVREGSAMPWPRTPSDVEETA